MANTSSTIRLKKDYLILKQTPVQYVVAEPLPTNILERHYVIIGPENTPYEGGFYRGKLVFPPEYPFKPPSIYMITPNGRFLTNTRLCLSFSDYHPESWNPSWTVSTILAGLLSFMAENSFGVGTTFLTPDCRRRQLAAQSLSFNQREQQFCELFPDVVETINDELKKGKGEEEKKVEGAGKSKGWFSDWFS